MINRGQTAVARAVLPGHSRGQAAANTGLWSRALLWPIGLRIHSFLLTGVVAWFLALPLHLCRVGCGLLRGFGAVVVLGSMLLGLVGVLVSVLPIQA